MSRGRRRGRRRRRRRGRRRGSLNGIHGFKLGHKLPRPAPDGRHCVERQRLAEVKQVRAVEHRFVVKDDEPVAGEDVGLPVADLLRPAQQELRLGAAHHDVHVLHDGVGRVAELGGLPHKDLGARRRRREGLRVGGETAGDLLEVVLPAPAVWEAALARDGVRVRKLLHVVAQQRHRGKLQRVLHGHNVGEANVRIAVAVCKVLVRRKPRDAACERDPRLVRGQVGLDQLQVRVDAVEQVRLAVGKVVHRQVVRL